MNYKNNISTWFTSNIFLISTAAIQLFGFVLLGRALGAAEYGQILAVTVFVSLGVEFVGLGCGDSLIKKVSTNKSLYPAIICECLVWCLITLPIVSAVIIVFLDIYTDINFSLIAILVVTELYSTRSLALMDHSSIAQKDITRLNLNKLTYACVRLGTIAIATFLFSTRTAWQWIPFQIFCSVFFTTVLLIMTVKRYGGVSRSEIRHLNISESVLFSLTQTMRALQSNVDKYAIQLSFSTIVFSLYAVAGRFLQYALIPLQAILRISYPKFFEAEKKEINSSIKLAVKLVPVVLTASLIPFSFLMWGGVIVELLLGKSYSGVGDYMRLLALIPVLLGLQYVFMDLLTALDAHKVRLSVAMVHVSSLCGYFFINTTKDLDRLIYGFILVNGLFVAIYFICALLKVFCFSDSKSHVI